MSSISSISSPSASRSIAVALDADRAGRPAASCAAAREVADRAADAGQPAARALEPRRALSISFGRTCSRSALTCLRLRLLAVGRKRSVIRTAPSGHERGSTAMRPSTRVSCIEPPPMSSTTPVRRASSS